MANPKRTLVHSKAQAAQLAITVPSTVVKDHLVIHDKAQELAEKIYKANGYYDKIAKANDKLEDYFKKALNSKGMNTEKVKKELTDAKKASHSRVTAATNRKTQCKTEFQNADDMNSVLKNT